MDNETKEHLHQQLIKLGDMMGDGLHHEPGGKWINREYKKVCRALGYIPTKKRDIDGINKRVSDCIANNSCKKCSGDLKQTRSGSYRVACVSCGSKYQLKKGRKK